MAANNPLTEIPGVGKTIAGDLNLLGYNEVQDLKNEDPELMYEKLKSIQGPGVCRCMLYVFRCAVYYASEENHQPHLLKWHNWKDK